MPYVTTVDPERRVGLVRAFGSVSGEDLAAADEALYHDSAWQPGFDEIWLCDGITEFSVLPHELKAVVRMETDARVGTGRVALVMTRDVVRMIGELYQQMMAGLNREVNVVFSLDEAARWLGMPAPPAWFSDPDRSTELVVVGGRRSGW